MKGEWPKRTRRGRCCWMSGGLSWTRPGRTSWLCRSIRDVCLSPAKQWPRHRRWDGSPCGWWPLMPERASRARSLALSAVLSRDPIVRDDGETRRNQACDTELSDSNLRAPKHILMTSLFRHTLKSSAYLRGKTPYLRRYTTRIVSTRVNGRKATARLHPISQYINLGSPIFSFSAFRSSHFATMAIETNPLPLPPSADPSKFAEFGREVIGIQPGKLSPEEFAEIENLLYKVRYPSLLSSLVILIEYGIASTPHCSSVTLSSLRSSNML